jgi:cytochrome P450
MGEGLIPPAPRGHWLSGHLPEVRQDSLGTYLRYARQYGDCVRLRFGPRRVYLLSHPDLIEEVLHSRNFIKHAGLRMNRMFFGNGLLTSEGDFWLRQRRLLQPAFQRDRLAAHVPVMVAHAEQLADSWRDGEVRDMHADMTRLTLGIISRTLFGAEVGAEAEEVRAALEETVATFNTRFFRLIRFPEWVPTPTNRRLRRAVRRIDAILYRLIDQRRACPDTATGHDDLLAILLRARHEDGSRMTDRQLRDEAMTLFLAGHDTTALALSWTLYLLAGHPDVADRLGAELREVLGEPPRLPTVADLPRLRYTEMVIQEVMRLYPPAYIVGREAISACMVGRYRIPAGGTVLMSQWVVHRDPRFYDEPERFRPERWADGLARRLPHYAYFPFGGGPRVCIGNTFALMETSLVLATLARRFRCSVPPGEPPVGLRPQITLRPRGPINLRLHAAS